jgi:cyclo(L-tyrosyl-L-tyrosyl) synthase
VLPAVPLTDRCSSPLSGAEHVCVGISPFNSYFSTERIISIAEWARTSFKSLHFFVPDRAAAYTLQALGYDENKARQKAARQANYVFNKIRRALDELDVPEPDDLILDSEQLENNSEFNRLRHQATSQFELDSEFRASCLDATRWVLDKRIPDGQEPTAQQLEIAVQYFLAELPMFLSTVEIVGVDSSVFAYHQRVDFLERLYRMELSLHPHPAQGFVVYETAELVTSHMSE